MNKLQHPVALLEKIPSFCPEPFAYEFSRYIYVPQSTKDERQYLRVSSLEIIARFEELVGSLGPSQELAFHSRIFSESGIFHIPMLDLTEGFSDVHVSAVASLMREFSIREFAAYHSGRSAHVYGIGLLSAERMIPFLARALLLNLPGRAPVVDARWVGHRIYAGYGSLRWSCNTSQYLSWPQKIGLFTV